MYPIFHVPQMCLITCGQEMHLDVPLPLIGRRQEVHRQKVHEDECLPLIGLHGKHGRLLVLPS